VKSDTYYDILGVSSSATSEEIKARYRSLILRIHPDLDGPVALFRQVQQAYEVLSDPVSRASYDRSLGSRGGVAPADPYPRPRGSREPGCDSSGRNAHSDWRARASDTSGSPSQSRRRNSTPGRGSTSTLRRQPAGIVAMAGAILLVFGAAVTGVGAVLMLLGAAAFIVAGVAGLGGRGAKEREAYQRSGMTAVDGMSGRQFEVLLENFFVNKGYRVARIGGRGEFGADLLLHDAHGRIIVQARRWTGLVPHNVVHQAVAARSHYGAARALVVTSSDYSEQAVTVAHSNDVTLWNRATLAAEMTVFRCEPFHTGFRRLSSELRAGSRICLGFLVVPLLVLFATRIRSRGQSSDTSRGST
jgi:hypothetical protein